jgi:RsiW-degrading membrane proteinase PrsW (M82 family)
MLLLAEDNTAGAVEALRKEAALPEAIFARQTVVGLALEFQDEGLLRDLLQDQSYRDDLRWQDRSQAGILVGDLWLQWTGIVADQWMSASAYGVLLSLLSASLWYIVLVRFSPAASWRWVWPLLPLLAGVASIWPTLLLQNFQEKSLNLLPTDIFPQSLIYEIMGVGLREEASKLLLFCLFLPWLLKRKEPGLALVTGAFVGLGFSLEENINYISMGADVWGRVLTASFLHLSLTGLTAHMLYGMWRSRFNEAGAFVASFLMAGVVHGVYNWAPQGSVSLPFAQDLDIVSLLLLAGMAHQFYTVLAATRKRGDGSISTLSVFVLGSALLVASGFITVALQSGLWQVVTMFGNAALGLVPIAVFHARKLG